MCDNCEDGEEDEDDEDDEEEDYTNVVQGTTESLLNKLEETVFISAKEISLGSFF